MVRVFGGHKEFGVYEYDLNRIVDNYEDIATIINADNIEVIGNIHDNPELVVRG